jgi:hypothetical protein
MFNCPVYVKYKRLCGIPTMLELQAELLLYPGAQRAIMPGELLIFCPSECGNKSMSEILWFQC